MQGWLIKIVICPHGRVACTNNGSRFLYSSRGHSLRVAGSSDKITIARPGIPIRALTCLRSTMFIFGYVLATPTGSSAVLSLILTTAVHRLLVAELQIRIRSKRQPPCGPVFNIDKLRDEATLEKLRHTFLGSGLSNGPADAGSAFD